MARETRTVGSIEITAIVDADLELDPITDGFPDIPPDALVADDDDAASVRTPGGDWRLRVRTWLIRRPASLLLVDTGIGGPTSPTQAWVPRPGDLLGELAALGVAPGDIPTVVITHVHDDHIGGSSMRPADPRSRTRATWCSERISSGSAHSAPRATRTERSGNCSCRSKWAGCWM